jgi:glucose dehydrogenase
MKRDFDVIVVGAGVAGAMVAYRLAQAGARVLILEAGSRNPARAQMVGQYATDSSKALHSPYVQTESDLKAPSPDVSITYYDQPPAPHPQYKSTYERRTGGSTWHWLGHTPRMLRSDFEMSTRYSGRSEFPAALVDWPITYDDLEP